MRLSRETQIFDDFEEGAKGIANSIESYAVIPMSASSGLIEFVENCWPLSTFENSKEPGVIYTYLSQNKSQKAPPLKILTYSSALFTVLTYFMGVGDRHNDNILINADGKFFHIDFGFILGHDPKKKIFIHVSDVRLSEVVLNACVAPPEEQDHPPSPSADANHFKKYEEFFNVCLDFYSVIRYYHNIFFYLLFSLAPDFYQESYVSQQLSKRFFVDFTDDEARGFFGHCLRTSIGRFGDYIRDLLHNRRALLKLKVNYFA